MRLRARQPGEPRRDPAWSDAGSLAEIDALRQRVAELEEHVRTLSARVAELER